MTEAKDNILSKKRPLISTLFIILLIIFVVLFFPKECGLKADINDSVHQCIGVPMSLSFINKNNAYNWCSGICSFKEDNTLNNGSISKSPAVIKEMFNSVSKYIIPLLIIVFLIIIFKWYLIIRKNKQ